MSEAAADRLWFPDEYLDEIMPEGRASPDAWLFRLDDGAHRYGEKDDAVWPSFAVAEGETVAFTYCENLQRSVLRFAADGTVSFPEGEPTGTWFWLYGDSDVCGDTLAELIAGMREAGDTEGDVIVGSSTWSQEEISLRFTALDGPPRFVAADPAP